MIAENRKPKIIVSIAAGIGRTIFESDFRKLEQIFKEAGFEGVSMLPLRTRQLTRNLLSDFPKPVLVEDGWNPGRYDNLILAGAQGASGEIRRRFLSDMTEPPLLQDTVFFPSRARSNKLVTELMKTFPNVFFGGRAQDIDRFPGRVHVHLQTQFMPQALSIEEIADNAEIKGVKLLYDPTHLAVSETAISLPGLPSQAPEEERLRQLRMLIDRGLVAGVDIHPASIRETEEFLNGKGFLTELAALAVNFNVGWIRSDIRLPGKYQLPILPFYRQESIVFFQEIVMRLQIARRSFQR